MNTHLLFRQVIDRITILTASAKRGLSPSRVGEELSEIRAQVQDLAVMFEEVHYYNVEVSHKDIPEECRIVPILLSDSMAELVRSADAKLGYMQTRVEQSAKILLAHEVEVLYDDQLTEVPHLLPRHVRLVSIVSDN